MTTTTVNKTSKFLSRTINGILAIPPVFHLAKSQARNMMIKRAEKIGVPWRKQVEEMQTLDWESELQQVQNPQLTYPEYYLRPFHAYDRGNLSWLAAWEVEVAAYAVHAGIWKDAGAKGDPQLRSSYHNIIRQLPIQPKNILDIGCSVGMSTLTLQELYPQAKITGVDLSPYFLAVASYRAQKENVEVDWLHAPAEATGLPDASFDLVSACLVFHELPQTPAKQIFAEARRLLRPGGYLTIMDMNPASEVYQKMPPYIFTLLKSTEPYLDEYFSLDLNEALVEAGFNSPIITSNSPRHRTIVASVKI